MLKSIKNGVVVSVVLDTRTINKEDTYPVKIKVYSQRKPKYYPTGVCFSLNEELENLWNGKSSESRMIQEEISKEFIRILKNVEYLTDKETYHHTEYIFPFMESGDDAWEHEKKKKNLTKNINDRMKRIGEELNIGKITTYMARHTYAPVLRNEGVPISQISSTLGHTSVTTTEIYLADLESEDRARDVRHLSF